MEKFPARTRSLNVIFQTNNCLCEYAVHYLSLSNLRVVKQRKDFPKKHRKIEKDFKISATSSSNESNSTSYQYSRVNSNDFTPECVKSAYLLYIGNECVSSMVSFLLF